jgi:NitT/TauT family transport system substrate-binding protein
LPRPIKKAGRLGGGVWEEMVMKHLRLTGALLGACLVFAGGARAADQVKIGILNTIGDIAVLIADEKGYFKQEGIEAELIAFDASAKMIPSLGVGDLDVGGGATAASLFNAIDRKIGVRIVADKGRTEPGYVYQSVMIRKDLITSGRFKSYADLKGLKFAQGAAGVGPWSVLNEAAKKGGVPYASIEKTYLPFPQQVAALQSGAIDGSIMNEPYKTIVAEQGLAVEFQPTEEFFSTYELSLLFFGDKFRTERKDVAHRFMKAFLRASRDYNDALSNGRWRTDGGADEVIGIFARRTKTPEALLRKITPHAADPDGRVALDSVRRDLAFFQDQGDVSNKALTVEDCLDASFAQRAAKELGPYVRRK